MVQTMLNPNIQTTWLIRLGRDLKEGGDGKEPVKHSAVFMAKVALEALKGLRTINE